MDSVVAQQEADFASLFDVYCGVWTNWSRGKVLGATLTLSRNDGNLLIAFLAFFVTIVGTQMWRIFCFAFHSLFSSETPRDGLHHQRQALLRNSGTAVAGFVTLIQLLWAWRQTAKNLYRRILPILSCTALFACAFAVASGYSSRVSTSAGNEVLLSGTNCRIENSSLVLSAVERETLWYPFDAKNVASALNYAEQCYSPNTTTGSLECSTYIKKRLYTSSIGNASCPFRPGACRSENTSLLLDTGLLDSNDDFGLNAPPGQRFQYRRRLHCAPLATKGLTSQHNISSDRSYTRYHFGPTPDSNYTYEYSNDAIWESKKLQTTSAVRDYTIGVLSASFSNGSLLPDYYDFSPAPSIAQDNADVLLFFLSANALVFAANTTDEWYRATHIAGSLHRGDNTTGSSFAVYAQDEPASPLGCVQQEQFCNGEQRCTPLTGSGDLYEKAGALFGDGGGDDASSTPAANRLWWAFETGFETAMLNEVVRMLATRSLVSKFSLTNGMQGPLPDNQWQLEVELWHNTLLAIVQENFVAAARGQSEDPRLDRLFIPPDSPEAESMCRNQKIRSTAYVSFSLLGLILILALGFLIILIALTIEPLVSCVQRRWGKTRGQYARLEWTATETLQLQRLAHEEVGFGDWTHAGDAIPITRTGDEMLGVLDVREPGHPRLLGKGETGVYGGGGVEGEGWKKEGGDGNIRVTVQERQNSSVSDGSGETLGRDGSVSPLETETRNDEVQHAAGSSETAT